MSLFIKVRQGIWDQPDYAELAESGSKTVNYVLLWEKICFISAESDDEGRLIHRLGKAYSVDDLSKKLRISIIKTTKFLQKCVSLDLISFENGTYSVIDYAEWYGKSTESYRERNRARQRKYKASLKSDDHEHEDEGNVTYDEQGNVTGNALRVRENREYRKERSDSKRAKSVTEVTLPESVEPLICLTDFSERDFLSVARDVHRRLKSRPLSGPDKTALLKTIADPAWSEYTLGDWAGALLIGADCTARKTESGDVDPNGNTWYYCVRVAEGNLERAADLNATNRFALSEGDVPILPMTWDGDQ